MQHIKNYLIFRNILTWPIIYNSKDTTTYLDSTKYCECVILTLFVELCDSFSFPPTWFNGSMDSWVVRTVCCFSSKQQNLCNNTGLCNTEFHFLEASNDNQQSTCH
jgi:hypothetical protein